MACNRSIRIPAAARDPNRPELNQPRQATAGVFHDRQASNDSCCMTLEPTLQRRLAAKAMGKMQAPTIDLVELAT
jgi:hypothetical protein